MQDSILGPLYFSFAIYMNDLLSCVTISKTLFDSTKIYNIVCCPRDSTASWMLAATLLQASKSDSQVKFVSEITSLSAVCSQSPTLIYCIQYHSLLLHTLEDYSFCITAQMLKVWTYSLFKVVKS